MLAADTQSAMTEFGFTATVAVRYQDHDTMGHVNNAVYVTYMEQARVEYLTNAAGISWEEMNMVVAHVDVDFRRSVQLASEVEVAVSVTDIGESSFTMAYEIRDEGGVAVEGETVQVTHDSQTGETCPVPAPWRDAIDRIEN